MGKRGPAPKPDRIRVLEGNPSKRPLRGDSPRPKGIPTCPSWLSPEAKQEWRRVAPELARLGLLTRLDRTALACYCTCYSWWRSAQETICSQGALYVTSKGQLRTRPEVEIAKQAAESMRDFAAEFGLTPTSRSRLLIPPSEEEIDPIEEMLRESEKRRRQK
ncbi:MAG: phage terminase small subunit P27 family [Chloroflexi bacterium]|nr:phage terminase small subunit P27 family [Chloroflexota bacterium]